jgi:predicted outer membrane repeat protein
VTAKSGVAVFSGLTLDNAAIGYTLLVSGSGETGATTSAFNVTPAAAAELVVTAQPPASVIAGSGFGLAVAAEDPFGNVDPNFGGSVAVALLNNPGAATLGGTTTVTAQSGLATFSGLRLDQPGTGYTVQATAIGLNGATTDAFNVFAPTVYTVDLTSANGTGSGNAGDLVYCIGLANANTNPAGSEIEFDPSVFSTPQTITLGATLVLSETTGPEVIDGPGAGLVMVSGNHTTEVFNIAGDNVVSMTGLSIIDGNGTYGGGVFNEGTLTITNTTFTGNSAPYGGAVYTRALVGHPLDGLLTLTGDTFSGNSATAESGAIDNWAGGSVTVTDDTFTGNSAPNGGAIGNEWGSVDVTNSTFSNNTASASTGAGGAIINYNPNDAFSNSLSVVGSTISRNAAVNGGGIANGGPDTLSLTNDTITGNSVTGTGGGLYDNGTTTLINCTVTGNSAAGGGGGMANVGGTVIIGNTIVAENTATAGGPDAQGDPVTSQGHNLISETDGSSGWVGSDLTGTFAQPLDPLLAPLGDYGGPTQTMALLPGSPALNAGVAVPRVTTDQRGVPRPQGNAPDIGAFESRGFIVTVVSGEGQRTQVGSDFPAPLVVAVVSPCGEPVTGGLVTFAAPATGAAADLVGNPATIDAGGHAGLTASANVYSGNYSVTAGASGAGTVAFALTNVADPTVVSLQRFGYHDHQTVLVLTFSEPMDAAQADNLANYHLVVAVPDHRPGVEDGRANRIRRALYDAANQTVTLWPIRRLPLRRTFLLTVKGTPPGGLTNASGTFLDGAGTGQPGSDYMGIVNRKSLAGQTRLH